MPQNGFITGTDGGAVLPNGLLLNVLHFDATVKFEEDDNTGLGASQESGTLTTFRVHGTATAQVKAGSPSLGNRYQNVPATFISDATAVDGKIEGTFNFNDMKVVSAGKKLNTLSFTFVSQSVTIGPLS